VTHDVSQFGRIAQAGAPNQEWTWPTIPSSGVPPGEVAVLFMEESPDEFKCPHNGAVSVGTAISQTASVKQTGRGQAWHITTDAPASMYDILPYGGAASFLPGATILFPTTSWGSNYVAVVPPYGSGMGSSAAGPQRGVLLALVDNTEVQIVPTVDLPSGTDVVAAPQNQVTTYTLKAGEFVQWALPYDHLAPPMEMSGSVIQSVSHIDGGTAPPVAFFGSSGFLCLASATSVGNGCDSEHEQIPPVSALGNEYAVAPYTTRLASLAPESLPYRIVGMVDGTILTYDPPIQGAPTTLGKGTWFDFEATDAFVVRSKNTDHPFYIAQMMTGWQLDGDSRSQQLGDADLVGVVPTAQFLPSYVFFTDLTYSTTTFTVVRKSAQGVFKDVQVGCMNKPISEWKDIGTPGTYQFAQVDLVRDGTGTGSCSNGPQRAKSQGPFGLTVWGTDHAASYSYAAGMNIASVNQVVVPIR
jgi:hypothetical protein